jgi:hypothetical protein
VQTNNGSSIPKKSIVLKRKFETGFAEEIEIKQRSGRSGIH